MKIISKGRDGYMGIGLSAQGVNMNRLPGKCVQFELILFRLFGTAVLLVKYENVCYGIF